MRTILERFTAPHLPGSLLGALNPRWGSRFAGGQARGVIRSIQPTGEHGAVIKIAPPVGWPRPAPGQFIALGVEVDGVLLTRCFTVTSLPDSKLIEITVQAHSSGTVSKQLVHLTRPGDSVVVGKPEGDFVLERRTQQATKPLLFVTAGSGLTPAVAMIRALIAEQAKSAENSNVPKVEPDVVVVHFVRTKSALLQAEELKKWSLHFDWISVVIHETRDSDDNPISSSRLSPDSLYAAAPDWTDRKSYVCGPQEMLESALDLWLGAGSQANLHLESFRPLSSAAASDVIDRSSSGSVRFSRSAISVEADSNTPLLDLAERAGLSPKSGCRMGVCHTCVSQVESGNVIDLRDGMIRGAGETVQICVSCPIDDVILDL